MKSKCLLTLSLVVFALLAQALDIKVMTWNIRYNNPDDGENAWPLRMENVIDLVLEHSPDVVGMQEALLGQVNDIANHLPGYDWVGVGRDDGLNRGEYSPIFYKAQKYQLKEQGWFWLSETPEKPGKGWDAALPRICTYVKLEDYETRKNFWVLNTHFDHVGEEARAESVRLIIDKIKEFNKKDKLPVILTGDLNLTPDQDPIAYLQRKLRDSKEKAEVEAPGPDGTFNGFDVNSSLENRIDYIFVNRKITVKSYGVLDQQYDGRYPSDHLPVLVDLWFK